MTIGTEYTWYNAAYGNMLDFSSTGGTERKGSPTSRGFMKGKTNTETMITKWNAGSNGGYGDQDTGGKYKDVWGQIQTKVDDGWFVPSFEEWSAFGFAFSQGKIKAGITSMGNYRTYGLGYGCWSSSQVDRSNAWLAVFEQWGSMQSKSVRTTFYEYRYYPIRFATMY